MNKPKTILKVTAQRATSAFLLFILLISLVSITSVYAGIQSGELNKTIIKPLKDQIIQIKDNFDQIAKDIKETEQIQNEIDNAPLPTITPNQINVRINDQQNVNYQYVVPTVIIKYNQGSTYQGKSIEEIRKENQDWYNQQVTASQQRMDQIKQQNDLKMQQFDAKAQQDMSDFQKASQQKIDEFKQQYGIK